MTTGSIDIHPFEVDIAQTDLDDLMERLAHVRWPNELPDVGWSYGVPLAFVRELVDYWRSGFDWRAQEARLNAHPQFVTTIDGQRLHFIHVRSPEPDAMPLICTHGWPMSVFEYVDLIGPLTDPRAHGGEVADAFDVVIPSLPGHAFSGPTTEAGWDTRRIARAWVELMDGLGYERYGAHGNDAGSLVSPEMGRIAPDRVVGVHVTQLFSFPSGDPAEFAGMSEEDMAAMKFLEEFARGGGPRLQPVPVRAATDDLLRAAGLARGLAGVGLPAVPALGRPRLPPRQRVGVLAHEHDRLIDPPLLRRRPRRRRADRADHCDDRRSDLRRRLPEHPEARGARPQGHRQLEPLRAR